MNDFFVSKNRRVFLDGVEIKRCLGFDVQVKAGGDPEVVLRVSVESISIEGYTDLLRAMRRESQT